MADASYDAVIIGGGHHGLVAACYLQDAGMSTVVLERQHELGGAMCSDENTAPGFLSNQCAHSTRFYIHPAYSDFKLAEKGLDLVFPELSEGMVFDNDKCFVPYHCYPVVDKATGRSQFDAKRLGKTLAQIARFSERDAETTRHITEKWNKEWGAAWIDVCYNPPTPWGEKNAIEQLMDDPSSGIEPIWQFMTIPRLAYDLYESPEMQVDFMRTAQKSCILHMNEVIGIDQLLGVIALGAGITAHSIVIGGTHAITHALQKAFTMMGGKFFVSNEVDRIIIENETAKGVRLLDGTEIEAKKLVVSTADPTQTILRFIGEEHVSHKIAHRARTIDYGVGVLWGFVALHEAPNYKAAAWNPDVLDMPKVLWGPCDPGYLKHKFQAEAYVFGYPRRLCVFSGRDTPWDPIRAPKGKHIIMFEEFSAPASYFSEREWIKIKHEFFDHLIQQWGEYAPNMTWDNVIGINCESSYDTEKRNINMREGDTAVGKSVASQMGRFRPFPEVSRYRIPPIKNLYLTGAGTHYAGGTGRGNSYCCFKVIAGDYGLKKIWEEKGRPY